MDPKRHHPIYICGPRNILRVTRSICLLPTVESNAIFYLSLNCHRIARCLQFQHWDWRASAAQGAMVLGAGGGVQ